MNDFDLEFPTPEAIQSRRFRERVFEVVADELASGSKREGLWLMAFAEADGDERRTQALYVRYRAQSILDDLVHEDSLSKNLPTLIEGFHHAAEYGDCVRLERTLARGINVDAQRADGATALYLSATNGKSEAVRLLLRHGADTSIENERGRNPADGARIAGHGAIADEIEAYGNSRR